MIVDLSLNDRIHERREHDLKFKQVAKGFISKGYLDPSDGNPLTTHCDVVVVLQWVCFYGYCTVSIYSVCFYGYHYCIYAVFISMVTVTVSMQCLFWTRVFMCLCGWAKMLHPTRREEVLSLHM